MQIRFPFRDYSWRCFCGADCEDDRHIATPIGVRPLVQSVSWRSSFGADGRWCRDPESDSLLARLQPGDKAMLHRAGFSPRNLSFAFFIDANGCIYRTSGRRIQDHLVCDLARVSIITQYVDGWKKQFSEACQITCDCLPFGEQNVPPPSPSRKW